MSERFRTVYDRQRVISDPGSPMVNDYSLRFDKDGKRSLEIVGEHSLYDEIQMYKDVTDIEAIVERFINLGDPSILNRKPTFYGDVTPLPETYAELLQFNSDVEKQFYELPLEIRSEFNNDLGQFIASMGNDKFFEVMAKYNGSDKEIIEKEEIKNAD